MPHGTFSVCVYCGARDGARPAFARAADSVGTMLAENGLRLVYGAGDVGLMGRVARAAQAGGGATLGVIPAHLMAREIGKRDLDALIVTETMHERKKVMFMNADAIVVLPGGAGTLDEVFEVLTWRQLGLHEKPVFFLDIDGYWSPLLDLLKHIVAEGFAGADLLRMYSIASSVDALADALSFITAARSAG
ncbi:MAG: TIGR00730 family Rossman fold protein [Pseudomonadota bacterium]